MNPEQHCVACRAWRHSPNLLGWIVLCALAIVAFVIVMQAGT